MGYLGARSSYTNIFLKTIFHLFVTDLFIYLPLLNKALAVVIVHEPHMG